MTNSQDNNKEWDKRIARVVDSMSYDPEVRAKAKMALEYIFQDELQTQRQSICEELEGLIKEMMTAHPDRDVIHRVDVLKRIKKIKDK